MADKADMTEAFRLLDEREKQRKALARLLEQVKALLPQRRAKNGW
jgi:hypothetical protein